MSFFSLFLRVLSALLTETQHLQALLPSVLLGVGREDISSKIWQRGNTTILWVFAGGGGGCHKLKELFASMLRPAEV